MKILWAPLFLFCLLLGTILFPSVAHASQVLIHNPTNHSMTCETDGETAMFTVSPGETFSLITQASSAPKIDRADFKDSILDSQLEEEEASGFSSQNNLKSQNPEITNPKSKIDELLAPQLIQEDNSKSKIHTTQLLDWVKCQGYTVDQLNVTSTSPDRYLSFNGQAQQTLSVLLYPYLPTNPNGNFLPMLERIVNEFQTKNPDILLNAVFSLNEDYDIYTYRNLPNLLGKDGFDIVELDTFMFDYLVKNNLIAPAPTQISTSAFWPVGLAASTYNGTLYGIPSWLCAYFLFARDQQIWNIDSVEKLIDYFSVPPSRWPNLITDYNSLWNLITFYLDGYADLYGVEQVPEALTKPVDSTVINSLAKMAAECQVGPNNNCINKYYNNNPDQSTQDFVKGNGDTLIGFSEQSFSILISNPESRLLFATPAPYGSQLFPLLFTDSFVLNSSTCGENRRECQEAAVKFMNYMSSIDTKLWITFSRDLPSGTPPRRSLPAIQAFYQHSDVQNDELYPQFEKILNNKNGNFPNTISPEKHYSMYIELCRAFHQVNPDYPPCDLKRTRQRVFQRAKDF